MDNDTIFFKQWKYMWLIVMKFIIFYKKYVKKIKIKVKVKNKKFYSRSWKFFSIFDIFKNVSF
jgi:hypothetical protein